MADVAHLTPTECLAQATRYLGKQEKEDWESLPEFHATPPDWDAFKEALFRDYLDARKSHMSSAVLDIFVKEKSQQGIHSLEEFTTFNREFRRITASLVAEGWSSPVELQKAYTKSINLNLHRKIHIYLNGEKAPHVKGEPYSIKQVCAAAEYILEGSDPQFKDIFTVQPAPSNSGHSPVVPAIKSETAELLNAINMLGQNLQVTLLGIQSLPQPGPQILPTRPPTPQRQERPRL